MTGGHTVGVKVGGSKSGVNVRGSMSGGGGQGQGDRVKVWVVGVR